MLAAVASARPRTSSQVTLAPAQAPCRQPPANDLPPAASATTELPPQQTARSLELTPRGEAQLVLPLARALELELPLRGPVPLEHQRPGWVFKL